MLGLCSPACRRRSSLITDVITSPIDKHVIITMFAHSGPFVAFHISLLNMKHHNIDFDRIANLPYTKYFLQRYLVWIGTIV